MSVERPRGRTRDGLADANAAGGASPGPHTGLSRSVGARLTVTRDCGRTLDRGRAGSWYGSASVATNERRSHSSVYYSSKLINETSRLLQGIGRVQGGRRTALSRLLLSCQAARKMSLPARQPHRGGNMMS